MSNTRLSPQEIVRFGTLCTEHQEYVRGLKHKWLHRNYHESRDVYEVMSSEERAKVDAKVAEWSTYITPLSEAWWKERGYGINWPDDNTQAVGYYLLEKTS